MVQNCSKLLKLNTSGHTVAYLKTILFKEFRSCR